MASYAKHTLYLFSVFCFSASVATFLPSTSRPFFRRTPSMYLLATFSLSPNSPRSSRSSSVNGTQNGSSSRISNPAKMSCGWAAPLVRLRISSAKPKLSATGSRAWMVKNGVPSFMISATTRPRRRVSTSYTRPSTSVDAWISTVYMASMRRGDQSRNAARRDD
ncbi:hypothetical protein TOPH_06285 [Tolypocladium ophioglossoides CBS 100239]|uniref:Secreted protein n=1 Tax=Tolypocladium ophioglossoides (strain CBS 100239) TaxID=1163406 RepID=A0A0L0N4Q2_TOLOC|nr:hypothetical protein TOPH_06285 [Tolypocladium ophioglossoides CBS 100239]